MTPDAIDLSMLIAHLTVEPGGTALTTEEAELLRGADPGDRVTVPAAIVMQGAPALAAIRDASGRSEDCIIVPAVVMIRKVQLARVSTLLNAAGQMTNPIEGISPLIIGRAVLPATRVRAADAP